jgi:hypothetical protein
MKEKTASTDYAQMLTVVYKVLNAGAIQHMDNFITAQRPCSAVAESSKTDRRHEVPFNEGVAGKMNTRQNKPVICQVSGSPPQSTK